MVESITETFIYWLQHNIVRRRNCMLEAFFNNEKTFSVFKYLLEADNYVSIAEMSIYLGVPKYAIYKVINNFDLLNMIKFASPSCIMLDLDNPIVLSMCILDELLEKYYMDDQKERITENGSFQQIIGDTDIENMSVLDFVECLKQINK